MVTKKAQTADMEAKLTAKIVGVQASPYTRHLLMLSAGVLLVALGLMWVVKGINTTMFGYDPLQWFWSESMIVFGSMIVGAAMSKMGQVRSEKSKGVGRG